MASLALCALLVALSAPPADALQDRPGRAQEDPEVLRKRDAVTRFEFLAGDYEEEDYEGATSRGVVPVPAVRCGYDPCAHLQATCLELQRVTSCLCPGVSGEGVVPEQPRLSEVTGVGKTSANINWCAPSSVVDSYRLVYWPLGTVGLNASTQPLPERSRLFALEGLRPGTGYRVCVTASNQAGVSRLGERDWGSEGRVPLPPGYGPCATFTTASASSLALCVTLAVVLPLLLGLALALTLHRCLTLRRRRLADLEPSIGLQNPSYEEDKVFKLQS